MRIGIIGAGQIGAVLTRQYRKAGHEVKITNKTGIEKLKALETETGARAVSMNEVAKDVAIVVISIPFIQIPDLAKSIAGRIPEDIIVIDTTNYYPIRDGRIDEIENGEVESAWVSKLLSRPVVKVYNSILAGSLAESGRPRGSGNRIALPLSGDSKRSKEVVAMLVNDSGFDTADIGSLADSWKQQPGSPIYCTDVNLSQIKSNLDSIQKNTLPERREMALQFILKQDPENWQGWYKDCVANNRKVYQTLLKN